MNNHFTIFNVILSIFYENKRNIFNDELILILKEKGYDAFILSSFDDIKKSIKDNDVLLDPDTIEDYFYVENGKLLHSYMKDEEKCWERLINFSPSDVLIVRNK